MKDLRCPLCKLPLQVNSQGLACENHHQFDRAKEGYFNLLPVHHKNSREPGDAKEQLQARREFLQAGFFEPLKSRLQAVVRAQLQTPAQTLLDIGCGEGYFTDGLAETLPQAQIYGLDIAKVGVRLAAKSTLDKLRCLYVVASSFDLPFADQSMDMVTRIYAPSKDSELWRVIKDDGYLVIVAPAEDHLLNLRQRIYTQVRPHEAPPVPLGFRLVGQERLTSALTITDKALCKALLAMTPFAWRMSIDLRTQIEEEGLVDQLDFGIHIYRRNSEYS
ncbi:23S rRNA (guanine(745)-N(1))-methyltransferase [Cellvibrio sp. KY-GH-1]|uniref:23S rRNA (guanine(745)-N(1))-methyltransferase n=1 Tax=Cellvibrio sp. KY-GH-1 TaxID=2303332 RepID=UPI001244570E|nr:23S rRNA (guanine(745)-N(1))-methyltransferase [Cellvibrio sp. KY-GH-1]QEY18816.1 23S rRNA (guanine(745)-N(1))-methyltransferase [Cellvibrio sp. KY-GH-1]